MLVLSLCAATVATAGTMLFPDGKSSYKGSWKIGKRHGKGIMMSVVGGETIVVVRAANPSHLK